MKNYIALVVVLIGLFLLSACTVDSEGRIHNPVAEGIQTSLETSAQVKAKQAELERSAREYALDAETAKKKADIELDLERQKLSLMFWASLANSAAQAAPWMVLVCAVAVVIWLGGIVYIRTRRAAIASTFAELPVDHETGTALAIITSSGWVVTPTGQQFKVGVEAPPNMKLAALAAHVQETLILARAAENIARHSNSADPARDLPGIGASVQQYLSKPEVEM